MFLREVGANDARFKTLHFQAGLNILVADRTAESAQGDSRNSVGKTSLIKVIRYLLGGDLPKEFKADELAEFVFSATLGLPRADGAQDAVVIRRKVKPTTKVEILGWSVIGDRVEIKVDEWRDLIAQYLFRIPEGATWPKPGQLWGALIRTFFDNPVKGYAQEPDWETGVKLGYLLGLSPTTLGQAGQIARLTSQNKKIKEAVKEGALAHLSLDESTLRAQLAAARRGRDKTLAGLQSFKVDEQYADHQVRADALTGQIQSLNDEALLLQRRSRELDSALADDVAPQSEAGLSEHLNRVYEELGVVLPGQVSRRFEEVRAFHASVVRNRRLFLKQEREATTRRLAEIDNERRKLDIERSSILALLRESVALDTFLSMQRDLAQQEAEVADLERRLESANSISNMNSTIKRKTAELATAVRAEVNDREATLDEAITLFADLGAEIYTDRVAQLLIQPTPNGLLSVAPRISGDASTGVRSVETFILDMVCIVSAVKAGRAPGILVHDSHLFDSVDGRQVASCLNVGARLADQYGFQYVVTSNTDFLDSVATQSEGAFDADPYILGTRLTDETEAGGLFGFRFS